MERIEDENGFAGFFDREEFNDSVMVSQKLFLDRISAEDSESELYRFEEGLKFIFISSTDNPSIPELTALLSDIFHPDIEIEPLFRKNTLADERFDDDGDLSRYIYVTLADVDVYHLNQSIFDIAYFLRARCRMQWVEPDLPVSFRQPSTISYSNRLSPNIANCAWALKNINADKAWGISPTANGHAKGEDISVAHLDTGWTNHKDLDTAAFDISRAGDIIDPHTENTPTAAFDNWGAGFNLGHGTKTGSVILSRGDVDAARKTGTSEPGKITGVAPQATYIPVRCIKNVVVMFHGRVAKGIAHAIRVRAHIVSMSLGGRRMRSMKKIIEKAVQANLIVVAAAGNNVRLVVWPARYKEVIAVAATNIDDKPWFHSSRGADVDISAPGEKVWHASPDIAQTLIQNGDGTSYATAHVAGVAALWLAHFNRDDLIQLLPGLRAQNLQECFRDALVRSARVPLGWQQGKFGAGIVDAEALLKKQAVPHVGAGDTESSMADLLSSFSSMPNINPEVVFSKIFSECRLGWKKASDFYSQEILHFFHDNPEVLDVIDSSFNLNDEETTIDELKSILAQNLSESFRESINCRPAIN